MNQDLIKELEKQLEKEMGAVEEQLKKFAKKDDTIAGDWDTRFPRFNGGNLEEAADEVEEYGNLLPVEHSLEIRLQNINLALGKIKTGKYGICENCGKEIPTERLKVSPESRFCVKCK